MKRLLTTLAIMAALMTHALAAGTISIFGTQQFDTQGRPLSGCLLYTFESGTTTPQSVFQDTDLTIPYPNPVECAADGRLPFAFIADGTIKLRLTNSAGVTMLTADGLLVVGPSSGSGGGSPVDATTVLATGDVKAKYGTGSLSGFVRLNGRTIGSSTSGATERANADCQDLFEYLWTTDANLTVSSGRGATANADWLANKTIALPDARGRVIAALDDMGNTAAGRLTSTYFGTSAIVLGATGGSESHTLLAAEMPSHTHTFSGTTSSDGSHTHTISRPENAVVNTDGNPIAGFAGSGTANTSSAGAHTHTYSGTTAAAGSGGAHKNVQPTILVTVYIKL